MSLRAFQTASIWTAVLGTCAASVSVTIMLIAWHSPPAPPLNADPAYRTDLSSPPYLLAIASLLSLSHCLWAAVRRFASLAHGSIEPKPLKDSMIAMLFLLVVFILVILVSSIRLLANYDGPVTDSGTFKGVSLNLLLLANALSMLSSSLCPTASSSSQPQADMPNGHASTQV